MFYDGKSDVLSTMLPYLQDDIWRFPEIGVPLNHPFLDGIFPYNHCWVPPCMEPPHVASIELEIEPLVLGNNSV